MAFYSKEFGFNRFSGQRFSASRFNPLRLFDPAAPTGLPVVKPDLSAWTIWWPLEAGSGNTFENAGAGGVSASYRGTFNYRSGGSGLPLWDSDPDLGGVVVQFGSPDPVTNAINAGSNLVLGKSQVDFAAVAQYDDLESSSNIFGSYDNDLGPASSRTGMLLYISAGALSVITGYGATAPNSAAISVPLIDAGILPGVPFLVEWKKYSNVYERLYVNGVFVAENTYSPLPSALGSVAVLQSSLGHYAFNAGTVTSQEGRGWRGPIGWMGLNWSAESTVLAADAAALALFESTNL